MAGLVCQLYRPGLGGSHRLCTVSLAGGAVSFDGLTSAKGSGLQTDPLACYLEAPGDHWDTVWHSSGQFRQRLVQVVFCFINGVWIGQCCRLSSGINRKQCHTFCLSNLYFSMATIGNPNLKDNWTNQIR